MAELRWYQTKAVEIFGALPEPRRYFLPWDMGAGKTLAAISIAKAYDRKKVLIIAPALIRENWRRELQTHWPEAEVGIIEWGRTRVLPEEKAALREKHYASPVQVVSYDLLKHVDPQGWDFIVIDEFHNLRSPRSVQSKVVHGLLRENPTAWAVGLSGTPIPNEAKQLWNPIDTFFPGRWGARTNVGGEAWTFLWYFCETEENEHGRRFFGLKPHRREELEKRFSEVSFRVVQKDFAEFLPPLYVEPLYFDKMVPPVRTAVDWYHTVKDASPHVGIYTHFRLTAHDIVARLKKEAGIDAILITGEIGTADRNRRLEEARTSERSLIVGTTHALKEGISLSFQKTAMVVEWTTAVDEIVQFIARFARQDSVTQTPTMLQFVVGPNDEGRAQTLRTRMDSINSVIRASRTSEAAADVFAERELTDEEFQRQLMSLVTTTEKRANLWAATDDEEDGDDD